MPFSSHGRLTALFAALALISAGVAVKLHLTATPPAILYAAESSGEGSVVGPEELQSLVSSELRKLFETLGCEALTFVCPCLNGVTASDALPRSNQTPSEPVLIDINKASAEELMLLPGIGPAYAERIIALRRERGGFVYKEELLDVPGIGPTRFSRLQDHVFVGPYEPETAAVEE